MAGCVIIEVVPKALCFHLVARIPINRIREKSKMTAEIPEFWNPCGERRDCFYL